MATPNYAFEKRQRDLEKKKKQEEKRLRKQAGKAADESGTAEELASDAANAVPVDDATPAKP